MATMVERLIASLQNLTDIKGISSQKMVNYEAIIPKPSGKLTYTRIVPNGITSLDFNGETISLTKEDYTKLEASLMVFLASFKLQRQIA